MSFFCFFSLNQEGREKQVPHQFCYSLSERASGERKKNFLYYKTYTFYSRLTRGKKSWGRRAKGGEKWQRERRVGVWVWVCFFFYFWIQTTNMCLFIGFLFSFSSKILRFCVLVCVCVINYLIPVEKRKPVFCFFLIVKILI